MDGHKEGLEMFRKYGYLRHIQEHRTWGIFGQVTLYVFSLGKLVTLGSYNIFKDDTIRYSFIICLVYAGLCLLSTFTLASFVGYYGNHLGVQLPVVTDYIGSFGWIMMPAVFVSTSAPVLWTILWFFMLACFAFGLKLALVETFTTSLLDLLPNIRRFRPYVVMATCIVLFLIGLPMNTEKDDWSLLIYHYTVWIRMLPPGFLIVALLVYGIPRFMRDIELMVGDKTMRFIPVKVGQVIIGGLLFLPTIVAILVTCVFIYETEKYAWSGWTDALRKASGWLPVIFLVAGAIWAVYGTRKNLKKDYLIFLTPTDNWGPASLGHRALVTRYVPWFKHRPVQSGNDNAAVSLDDISTSEANTDATDTYERL